jgi:phytoene dehydrogenase-like protein
VEFARVFSSLSKIDTTGFQDTTLGDWLARTFADPSARRAMAAFTRVATYGNAPFIASAGATLDQLKLGLAGVTYIDGGWQSLVDGLQAAAVEAGVTIRRDARVASVAQVTGGWDLRMAGGSHRFDAVILATPPGVACQLYPSELLESWARDAVPVRAAVLDVVLSGLPNPAGKFALGFDQPTYLSAHSEVAKLAASGRVLISTAWYRAPGETKADGDIERALEASLDIVQPGWRDALVFKRFLPDLVVTGDYARAATAGLLRRPGPGVPGAPGLFVAGDWVGPEGMLADAAVASGERAANLAANRRVTSRQATLAAAG